MRIAVPKEIKDNEYRVGLVPASVRELCEHGHEVRVEASAGHGIGVSDDDYVAAGAAIDGDVEALFQWAEMIVKVKEPQAVERKRLREGQVLFTYLHLAPDPEQTRDLVESGAVCVAYETVTSPRGGLPLLAPMSEVAGRMSVQAGARCLEESMGGRGVLLGGVPGVKPAKVVIIGGGVVGFNAAQMAVGMGAEVTILDRNLDTLRQVDAHFDTRVRTVYSNRHNLEEEVFAADLVIGAVLVPGAAAPKLVTRDMLGQMLSGSVLVDVAIDQGGCFETSRPTTHSLPTYVIDDVVHYCVANMPGAVPRTSAFSLNNATLPYVLKLADKGYKDALLADEHFMNGLNVAFGKVTCHEVAESLACDYVPAKKVLGD